MAPAQSSMSRFLYESQVPDSGAVGLGSADGLLEPALPNAKCIAGLGGSEFVVDGASSSQSDCILVNVIPALVEPQGESDLQILANAVGSPLHATARQRR